METEQYGSPTQERAHLVRARYVALRAQFLAHEAASRDAARFSLGREHAEKREAAERYARGVRNYSRTIAELTQAFALRPVDLSVAPHTAEALDRLFAEERPRRRDAR